MQMLVARIVRRAACYGVAVTILAACAKPHVVDGRLTAAGAPATDFSADDQSVTFTARFSGPLPATDRFMVEWLFPDGKIYLRNPLGRDANRHDRVETSLLVRGKAPARFPGLWQVRLWRGSEVLAERSFEVRQPAPTTQSAVAGFLSLALCGPSRWNDPVISSRRSAFAARGVPGAWVGAELLAAVGATYSRAVLLSGCAPG